MNCSLINGPLKHILLTGATGYLGTHLLAGLLESTSANIKCLVRAESQILAWNRVVQSLVKFKRWQPQWQDRLQVVVADLAVNRLGLSQPDYFSLAVGMDVIIHNGANVNYVLSYEQLKPINVNGTQELLRLAEELQIPFVYISTLRLFDARFDGVPITELESVDEKGTAYAGYSRSKWMAEKLIASAGKRGMPYMIVRPGLICGDELLGIPNVNDALARLIKGCIEIGCAPISELQVNLTPIDYVVRGLLALLLNPNSNAKVFHLVNDKATLCNDVMFTLRDAGYALEFLPYKDWVAKLRKTAATGSNFLLPLLQYFAEDLPAQSQRRIFNSQYTQDHLMDMEVAPSPVTSKLLHKNIEEMIGFGFIAAPEAQLVP